MSVASRRRGPSFCDNRTRRRGAWPAETCARTACRRSGSGSAWLRRGFAGARAGWTGRRTRARTGRSGTAARPCACASVPGAATDERTPCHTEDSDTAACVSWRASWALPSSRIPNIAQQTDHHIDEQWTHSTAKQCLQNYNSTSIRRPFDCLSKIINVTVLLNTVLNEAYWFLGSKGQGSRSGLPPSTASRICISTEGTLWLFF